MAAPLFARVDCLVWAVNRRRNTVLLLRSPVTFHDGTSFFCSRAQSVILLLLVVHLQAWLLKRKKKICRSSEMCILLGHGKSRDAERERDREREREREREVCGGVTTYLVAHICRMIRRQAVTPNCRMVDILWDAEYTAVSKSLVTEPCSKPCHRTLLKALLLNLAQSKPCQRTFLKALPRNLAQSLGTESCSRPCHRAKVCWIEN